MAVRGPLGTRDLAFASAERRMQLERKIVRALEGSGARPIITPPIETLATLELGMAALDRRELLRFVDIDTGDSLALRPDITPQVARALAARKDELTLPLRVWYAGDVMRRARGRARLNRQVHQIGSEWLGESTIATDVALLELLHKILLSIGLRNHLIELRVPVFAGTLLDTIVEPTLRNLLAQAIRCKDVRALSELPLSREQSAWAMLLATSYGPLAQLASVRLSGISTQHSEALQPLRDTARRLAKLGLTRGGHFAFDLGEFGDQGYYTGLAFTVFADGPGAPIGAGGRYDELFGRFGWRIPALGFAFDLGNVELAVQRAETRKSESAGKTPAKRVRRVSSE